MKEVLFKSLPLYIVAIIIPHKSNILEDIRAVIFPSYVIIQR
ncbi:hypothetical protein [uncultured Methanobrevibacter sp.]|nr:hypothetical protein [uncultured Methanobrevibacter sp.]